MASPDPWNADATRPLHEMERHDQLCSAYEEALNEGRGPPLEEVLAKVPEGERPALFVHLVWVAWEKGKPPPTEEELAERFPQYAHLVPVAAAGRTRPEVLPTLPGYTIEEKVSEGGMGVVYRAWQVALGRPVAVKMIRSGALAGTTEVRRFEREAKAAGTLTHPRVVRVLDAGTHAGQPYCVMEFVPGGTLAKRIDGRPVDPRRAADVTADVADGVQHIHDNGFVHRDLKPSNVLLDAENRPLVADFGLVRSLAGDAGTITHSRAVVGTAGYMAPEVAGGNARDARPAADIYALGAILFELLTGRPPFREETFEQTLLKVIHADPPRPSDLANGVPPDLEAVCLKCLEKDPARRYATAADLAADLRRWRAGGSVLARPLSDHELIDRWAHRVGYDLGDLLACDRWAYTYAAVHQSTGRRVVLVVGNTRSGQPARAALLRQAKVLAGLKHLNVVRLFNCVDDAENPYLVLEDADGTPLVRPLKPEVVIDVASQLAAGLHAVHDRGALHLGVCHAAVGVTADGVPRLGGFGSARPVGTPFDDLVPRVGGMNRANYAAPEVLARQWEKVGPTADVFGLGAVMYELLTGRPPFHTPTLAATRRWVLRGSPAPLSVEIPAPLAALVMDCLAVDPAARPQRAMDVASRLGQIDPDDEPTLQDDEEVPPVPGRKTFRLRVVSGPYSVGEQVQSDRRVTVGREEGCHLRLRSDKVSKRHFTVQFSAVSGRCVLTDSGSLNGVKVNDRRVDGSQPLADGDLIAVAAYVLAFETD